LQFNLLSLIFVSVVYDYVLMVNLFIFVLL